MSSFQVSHKEISSTDFHKTPKNSYFNTARTQLTQCYIMFLRYKNGYFTIEISGMRLKS